MCESTLASDFRHSHCNRQMCRQRAGAVFIRNVQSNQANEVDDFVLGTASSAKTLCRNVQAMSRQLNARLIQPPKRARGIFTTLRHDLRDTNGTTDTTGLKQTVWNCLYSHPHQSSVCLMEGHCDCIPDLGRRICLFAFLEIHCSEGKK